MAQENFESTNEIVDLDQLNLSKFDSYKTATSTLLSMYINRYDVAQDQGLSFYDLHRCRPDLSHDTHLRCPCYIRVRINDEDFYCHQYIYMTTFKILRAANATNATNVFSLLQKFSRQILHNRIIRDEIIEFSLSRRQRNRDYLLDENDEKEEFKTVKMFSSRYNGSPSLRVSTLLLWDFLARGGRQGRQGVQGVMVGHTILQRDDEGADDDDIDFSDEVTMSMERLLPLMYPSCHCHDMKLVTRRVQVALVLDGNEDGVYPSVVVVYPHLGPYHATIEREERDNVYDDLPRLELERDQTLRVSGSQNQESIELTRDLVTLQASDLVNNSSLKFAPQDIHKTSRSDYFHCIFSVPYYESKNQSFRYPCLIHRNNLSEESVTNAGEMVGGDRLAVRDSFKIMYPMHLTSTLSPSHNDAEVPDSLLKTVYALLKLPAVSKRVLTNHNKEILRDLNHCKTLFATGPDQDSAFCGTVRQILRDARYFAPPFAPNSFLFVTSRTKKQFQKRRKFLSLKGANENIYFVDQEKIESFVISMQMVLTEILSQSTGDGFWAFNKSLSNEEKRDWMNEVASYTRLDGTTMQITMRVVRNQQLQDVTLTRKRVLNFVVLYLMLSVGSRFKDISSKHSWFFPLIEQDCEFFDDCILTLGISKTKPMGRTMEEKTQWQENYRTYMNSQVRKIKSIQRILLNGGNNFMQEESNLGEFVSSLRRLNFGAIRGSNDFGRLQRYYSEIQNAMDDRLPANMTFETYEKAVTQTGYVRSKPLLFDLTSKTLMEIQKWLYDIDIDLEKHQVNTVESNKLLNSKFVSVDEIKTKLINEKTIVISSFMSKQGYVQRLSPHSFRKIYASESYDRYGDMRMTKAAWISRVLGHDTSNYTSSLTYQTVQISRRQVTDEQQVHDLMKALASASETRETQLVTFLDDLTRDLRRASRVLRCVCEAPDEARDEAPDEAPEARSAPVSEGIADLQRVLRTIEESRAQSERACFMMYVLVVVPSNGSILLRRGSNAPARAGGAPQKYGLSDAPVRATGPTVSKFLHNLLCAILWCSATCFEFVTTYVLMLHVENSHRYFTRLQAHFKNRFYLQVTRSMLRKALESVKKLLMDDFEVRPRLLKKLGGPQELPVSLLPIIQEFKSEGTLMSDMERRCIASYLAESMDARFRTEMMLEMYNEEQQDICIENEEFSIRRALPPLNTDKIAQTLNVLLKEQSNVTHVMNLIRFA